MGTDQKAQQCPQCYTVNVTDSRFCSKCGTLLDDGFETLSYATSSQAAADATSRFNPGDFFDDRYRIIEEIGRGGMGRVYKAEDTKLEITVALKTILPRFSKDKSFIERFKQEILTARSISHENIIRIYDLGESNRIQYISMEYIKGQNLRDFIQSSGALSIPTAQNLTRQLCSALEAAHQKGIIHQDLKPSNIMVDTSGHAYIMDFGLARSFFRRDADRSMSASGTPRYMSPEQAKGEPLDQRSDLYSLGVIMYEMLTGSPLFEADSTSDYLEKHIREIPASPSTLNPRISPDIEKIILRCLDKEAEARFQSAEEILRALDAGAGPSRLTLFDRLKKRWYWALVPVLLAAIALSVHFWRKVQPLPTTQTGRLSLAIVNLSNNTGDESLDYFGRAVSELLIADLLPSKYIRVLSGDRTYAALRKLGLVDMSTYSTDDLRSIASELRAQYIVSGHIAGGRDMLRATTILHDAGSMEVVGTQMADGMDEDSIFPMVDTLTRHVKQGLRLSSASIASDIDQEVTSITTGSSKALQHYMEALQLFNVGKLAESTEELEKAVVADPEFAIAYRDLSTNYSYLGDTEKRDYNMSKAVSLLNRVSEREYYLIQADAAYTTEMTIENFEKLLSIYPDDLEALGGLGSIYRNLEEWDLAQEKFEKIIEIDDSQQLSFENLAHIYMARGFYEKSREILLPRLETARSPFTFHIRLGLSYLCESLYAEAIAEAERAEAIENSDFEGTELKGHVFQTMGDFIRAEEAYQGLINSQDVYDQYVGRFWLSHLYVLLGRYRQAQEEIQSGQRHSREINFIIGIYNNHILSAYTFLRQGDLTRALEEATLAVEAAYDARYTKYKIFSLHLRGLVLTEMGRLDQSLQLAQRMKTLIEESGLRKCMRHQQHLMGAISMQEGDTASAVSSFEAAAGLLDKEFNKGDRHLMFMDSLASAYRAAGDTEKARNTYKRIERLTTGRLRWGDKYALSFYRLGVIEQEAGHRNTAAAHFQEFLEFWSGADPDIPEIADAKSRLASLSGPLAAPAVSASR